MFRTVSDTGYTQDSVLCTSAPDLKIGRHHHLFAISHFAKKSAALHLLVRLRNSAILKPWSIGVINLLSPLNPHPSPIRRPRRRYSLGGRPSGLVSNRPA